jgi:hypothetical protein
LSRNVCKLAEVNIVSINNSIKKKTRNFKSVYQLLKSRTILRRKAGSSTEYKTNSEHLFVFIVIYYPATEEEESITAYLC